MVFNDCGLVFLKDDFRDALVLWKDDFWLKGKFLMVLREVMVFCMNNLVVY